MSLLEIMQKYKGSTCQAPIATGLHGNFAGTLLDCDCVNDDCTTETYCED